MRVRLGKLSDGPVSRHLNRRFSSFITTKILARTGLTPNQVTWLVFLVTIAAAPAYALGLYCLAGILAQLGSMLDGCDGELARLKGMESRLGEFYDTVLDRYADIAVLAAATYRLALDIGPWAAHLVWVAGLLAVSGSVMTSYTSLFVKRALGGLDVAWPAVLSDSRDVRMLCLAAASLVASFEPLALLACLVWMAVVTNAKSWYRLVKAPEVFR